jgi:plasmid stability protein
MPDLLIRDIDPEIWQQLEERARKHGQSLSDEASSLIRKGLIMPMVASEGERGLGTIMMELIRPEDRGDDLIFEYRGDVSNPPDFE